jgi:hypothetical protein
VLIPVGSWPTGINSFPVVGATDRWWPGLSDSGAGVGTGKLGPTVSGLDRAVLIGGDPPVGDPEKGKGGG